MFPLVIKIFQKSYKRTQQYINIQITCYKKNDFDKFDPIYQLGIWIKKNS